MPTRMRLALLLTGSLVALLSISCTYAVDDLQVLDDCDERAFPGDGRSLVTGTHGCSGEPELLGNWMLEVIEDGDVVATEPRPFAWGNHLRVNRHVVGVYARNLDTGKPLYLKIPKRYQLAPQDPKGAFAEAIHFGIDGGLVITCQREGRPGAIVWHFDKQPQIVDLNAITPPPCPAQLPPELKDVRRFQQDLEGWFYAELSENKRVSTARALGGGYFVVCSDYTNCEYMGLTTPDGKAWQWKHVFPIGENAPSVHLPANLVPLKRLVFADYVNGSSIAKLKTVDADGVHTQAEFSSGLISSVAVSGNQKYALVSYSVDSRVRAIDDAYAGLIYDLDSQKVVKLFALPEVVSYGITDRMALLVQGKNTDYSLIEKLDDGSSEQLQEFNVLQPAKMKTRRDH